MHWYFTPYAAPLLASAVFSAVLGAYAWKWRRTAPYAETFAWLVFSGVIWSAGYALELMGADLHTKILLAKLQYFGIAILFPLIFAFTLQYTDRQQLLSRRNLSLLAVIPGITIALALTNEWHRLIWSATSLELQGSVTLLALQHGTWFWIQGIFSSALFLSSVALLVRAYLDSGNPYRKQMALLLAGLLIPPAVGAGYLVGVTPVPHLDLAPFAFMISVLLFTLGIFRFRLLELLPVARHTVVERMGDAVIVLDHEGRVIDLNPSAESTLGVDADAAIGCPAEEVFSRLPQVRQRLRDVLVTEEEIAVGEGSTRRDFSLSVAPMWERQGHSAGRLVVLRDVTERTRAEESVRQSEEKFRKIFQTSSDAAAISTIDDGTLLDVNQRFVEIIGYRREELLGKTVLELGFWREPDMRADIVRRLRQGEMVRDVEIKFRTRDGALRVGLFSAQVLELVGERRMIAMVKDVTEYKQLQDHIRQAQKMDAIGTLAGGIAHDFNNHLTSILGNVTSMLETIDSGDRFRAELEEVREAAELAAALTREILIFSRRDMVKPRVLDLDAVISDTARMLRRIVGPDVRLELRLAQGLHAIRADHSQIKQVLINLVSNARDAMPAGGRVTIETANVSLQNGYSRLLPETAPGPYVLLNVVDTGHGMNPQVLQRIFEPFFTTKEAGQGTGLGLSVVYGIVRQNEGQILVHSEPGQGARFEIYLPAVMASVDGETERCAELPAGAGETILVAEDEDLVRGVTVRVLQRHGYTVLQADCPEDALRLCRSYEGPIHLLLTDVVMPRISGEELAQLATKARPAMRVLYTSGNSAASLTPVAGKVASQKFLQKPFDVKGLLTKVREALDA